MLDVDSYNILSLPSAISSDGLDSALEKWRLLLQNTSWWTSAKRAYLVRLYPTRSQIDILLGSTYADDSLLLASAAAIAFNPTFWK